MKFIEFITKKSFYRELIYAIIIFIILAIIGFFLSGIYTRHNKSVVTPNLIGLNEEEYNKISNIEEFSIVVIDSIYDDDHKPGSIISQDPVAGTKVKPGRNVYVTMISHIPERVILPELRDLSLRQALSLLETYGLEVGDIKYVPDIAANAVLGYNVNGDNVSSGTLILKKSIINLTVGKSIEQKNIYLPNLIGKSREEALSILNQQGFYSISEVFSGTSDSTNAFVYEQIPSYYPNATIGTDVNFVLTYMTKSDVDFDAIIKQNEENENSDSKINEDLF